MVSLPRRATYLVPCRCYLDDFISNCRNVMRFMSRRHTVASCGLGPGTRPRWRRFHLPIVADGLKHLYTKLTKKPRTKRIALTKVLGLHRGTAAARAAASRRRRRHRLRRRHCCPSSLPLPSPAQSTLSLVTAVIVAGAAHTATSAAITAATDAALRCRRQHRAAVAAARTYAVLPPSLLPPPPPCRRH